MNGNKLKGLLAFGGIAVAVILGVLLWLHGWGLWAAFFTSGRGGWVFGIGIIAIIAAVVVFFMANSFIPRVVAVLAAVAILGLLILGWVRVGYDSAVKYEGSIDISDKAVPSFDQRAPYQVALQTAQRNLQDTTGELQSVKSVVDQGEIGAWNSIVIRRGWVQGYESIQSIQVPLYGSVKGGQDVDICTFSDKAGLRFDGGLPSNNLNRAIFNAAPKNVTFNFSDAYFYCDNDTPYVVAPLVQVKGWYAPSWTPYGVAVYNGSTGELDILTDSAEIAKLSGPTYPKSIAEKQRESSVAAGSFNDYFFKKVGFADTSGDSDDPNSGNNSEFLLREEGTKELDWATPLTPPGSSNSIVALGVVDADAFKSGELSPYTIHKFEDSRAANSSVADNIRNQYSYMPELSGNRFGIFEIVPAEDGSWVASIGQEQSVIYRAVVAVDGTISLYKNGELVGSANVNDEDGETDSGSGSTGPIPSDLSTLSPEQLRDLGQDVLDELSRRSTVPTE